MTEAIQYGIEAVPGNKDNIMSMRWESNDLIGELWLRLAYKRPVRRDGRISLQNIYENDELKPLLNVQGATRIITLIQSIINPVVALSNLQYDQAMQMFINIKHTVRKAVIKHGNEWGCEDASSKRQVLQIVEDLVLPQLMRAVNGHESRQSATQIVERVEQGSYTQDVRNSGGLFGSGRRKGRDDSYYGRLGQ